MVHAVYIPICFTMCVYRIAFFKSIELSTRAGFYCFIGKFCCLEKGQLCAVSVVENSITLQYSLQTFNAKNTNLLNLQYSLKVSQTSAPIFL